MTEKENQGEDRSKRRRSSSSSKRTSSSHASGRSSRGATSHSSGSSGASSRKSSSRRSSSKASAYYKVKRQNTILKSFVVLLTAATIGVALFAYGYVNQSKQSIVNQQYEMDQVLLKHKDQDEEYENIKEQMASLVQGKVPGLNPIVFDKVIMVEKHYVKSMLLNVNGKEKKKQYEFSINLQNKFGNIMQPRIKIYLFDRTGLQIGIADLYHFKDEILVPGEKRTYHGKFDVRMKDREPAYFIVETYANRR